MILAISSDKVIGIGFDLPWHQSEDMKRFRELTTGFPIIMGRTTHVSIGKTLPNRKNIVISNSPDYNVYEGSFKVSSFEEAIKLAEEDGKEMAFIIGGARLFQETFNIVDELYLTLIEADFYHKDAIKLKDFDYDNGEMSVIKYEEYDKDDKNEYDYVFIDFKRYEK